ncbi:MAG: hypothetical protein H0T09_06050 [Actinobacteria bacterium]|nr:hypothetical protein [Actinomycetota bacterium]
MRYLEEIRLEIEHLSDERTELWQKLSAGHDPSAAAELKQLQERLARLWDEQREAKAQLRFGNREDIVRRARAEERLSRAA